MVNLLYLTKNENQSFVAFIPIGNMTEVHNVLRNKGRWRTGAEGGKGFGKWECGEVAPGVIWLSQPASSNRGLWRELLRAKWEQLGEGKRAAGESRQQWREIQIKFFRVSSAGLVTSEAVEGRMSQGGWCRARLGERWRKVLRYKNIAVRKELTGCQ